jgi:hypothetical protein
MDDSRRCGGDEERGCVGRGGAHHRQRRIPVGLRPAARAAAVDACIWASGQR